jgi:hypothetical protein
VAVLFARSDSVYKSFHQCDVFDQVRDARSFKFDLPVIAHPPCRGWGRVRGLSNHTQDELELGVFAVGAVRACGGVLEHPAGSKLWERMHLPSPGYFDRLGGFTLPIVQQAWGHRAEKKTWLYICGLPFDQVPVMPLALGRAERVVGSSSIRKGQLGFRSEVTRSEREATPRRLAEWLVDLVERTSKPHFVESVPEIFRDVSPQAVGQDPQPRLNHGEPCSLPDVVARQLVLNFNLAPYLTDGGSEPKASPHNSPRFQKLIASKSLQDLIAPDLPPADKHSQLSKLYGVAK